MVKKILSFMIFFLVSTQTFADIQVKLVFILGNVQYKETIKSKEWKKADLNMTFNEKASLRTGKGSLAMIMINDDIKIKISSMSTMEFKSLKDQKTLQLYTGKIWSKVDRQEGLNKFSVRSPTTVCGVRGTEFIFETTQEEDKLYVSDGTVEFSKISQPEKVSQVKPGEIAQLKKIKKTENEIQVKTASFEEIKNLKGEFDIKDLKKIPFYNSSVDSYWDWEKDKTDKK